MVAGTALSVLGAITGCKSDEPLPKPDPVEVNKKPIIIFLKAVKGLYQDAPAGTKVAHFSAIDRDGKIVKGELVEGADKFEIKGFDPKAQEKGKYARAEIVTKADATLTAIEKISLAVTDDKNETSAQKAREVSFERVIVNEAPKILEPTMKVAGITNILRLDNNQSYQWDAKGKRLPYHVRTNFPNDLLIEAQLKDTDGEIKNALVEIIDTSTGKVVQKKELKKHKRTGKLTRGDIGFYDPYNRGKENYNPWRIGKCYIDGSCKNKILTTADLYKDSHGNNIKIHFPNMKPGTYEATITATDDEGKKTVKKVPETATVEPIKLVSNCRNKVYCLFHKNRHKCIKTAVRKGR